ncbi:MULTISPECIES: zinc-dependent alcohol dehydrogenase [unclassified Inquilinus]|uniref:zinc-dependent alcohol dehydrogenase n=1 Tax=unclassified Inquilinus TaxID=2645927 RepID=UPI003F8EF709
MNIKLARVTGPRRMEVFEASRPVPGPNEMLIRVVAAGVCHSDIPAFAGTLAPPADPTGNTSDGPRLGYPYTLGHEPTGIVEELGSGVSEFAIGDLVSGVGWYAANQSFASHALLRENLSVPVPSKVQAEHALAEPLGAVVNIVRSSGIKVGDRVAVVGCGFMGLLTLSLLRRNPDINVSAIDIRDDRLNLAAELGASCILSASDDVALNRYYKGPRSTAGADVVFELSGQMAGFGLALRLIKQRGGRIVASSTYTGTQLFTFGESFMMKAPTVLAVHPDFSPDFRDDMATAMALLARGAWPMEQLVTHRYSLAECEIAHADALDNKTGYIKGVVTP